MLEAVHSLLEAVHAQLEAVHAPIEAVHAPIEAVHALLEADSLLRDSHGYRFDHAIQIRLQFRVHAPRIASIAGRHP